MTKTITEAGRKAAEERARRRAEALRANLKRRKAAESNKEGKDKDAKPENSQR